MPETRHGANPALTMAPTTGEAHACDCPQKAGQKTFPNRLFQLKEPRFRAPPISAGHGGFLEIGKRGNETLGQQFTGYQTPNAVSERHWRNHLSKAGGL